MTRRCHLISRHIIHLLLLHGVSIAFLGTQPTIDHDIVPPYSYRSHFLSGAPQLIITTV